MRWHYILLFLFLCAAATPAAALNPVNVSVTSGKDWLIADGTDTAPITITVTDATNMPIPGADLAISFNTSAWSVRDPILKTDGSGSAQTLFLPTTKSGTAFITVSATVAGLTPGPVIGTLVQKIDAGTPYATRNSYPSVATVASTNNLTVSVTDKYGNPVTGLRLPNSVGFVTTSSGSGGFSDGMGNLVKTASVLLNGTGYATISYRLDTKAGDNFVMIAPPSPLGPSLIDITGIGDSQPYSIIQSVSPSGNPPYVMADGVSQATIDYYLYDEWGNPSTNQEIDITTSIGEEKTFTTNQNGHATILYGPKLDAGFYYITATAVNNESVKVAQTLQFVSGKPTSMLLTASPQTMASRDANPNMTAGVIAKVIDEKGNPVKGETVDFRIEKSDSTPYPRTQDPAIGSGGVTTTAVGAPIPIITDVDGQAILTFYPGAFPTSGQAGWNANAQGTVIVNATWVGKDATVTQLINLSYKNYPFLSVYTDVNPKTVQVGGAVDVSVQLKGDGWAMWPLPIDVVLCTDRSATMLYNQSIDAFGNLVDESPNDRMVDAMNAANAFVSKTTPGKDRIGLVSFGDPPYSIALLYPTGNTGYDKNISGVAFRAGNDYVCSPNDCKDTPADRDSTDDIAYVNAHYPGHGAKGKNYNALNVETGVALEAPLTYDQTQIKNAINSMVPAGGTPMRGALYWSVKQIINDPAIVAHQRDGSVRAIVLLTDGKWATGGDPQGTENSPTSPSIKSYPELGTLGTGSVITWAKSNGIKIFTIALVGSPNSTTDAPNIAELQAYADKTGGKAYVANSGLDLNRIYSDIAGELREEASINTHVALDFTNVQVNASSQPGNQVFEYMYLSPNKSTYVVPPLGLPYVRDDTANWTNNQMFTFDPGNITVNQVWRVNFTLRVLTGGNIKVLSSNTSKVTFVGSPNSVDIPDTFITAIPAGTEMGPQNIPFTIHFENPPRTNPDSDKQIASMIWDVTYGGKDTSISQQIWVAPLYSEAYQYVDTIVTPRAQDMVTYNMAISNLKPGQYKVKVIGHVNDANDASDIATINIPEDIPVAQIRIQ